MEQQNTQNVSTSSTIDEIKKLHELLQEGILTQEEFDKQKTILLNRQEAQQQTVVQPTVNNPFDNRSTDVRFQQELAKLHTKGTLAIVFAFISPLICWIIGGIGCSQCNQLSIEFPKSKEIDNEKNRCETGIGLGIAVFSILVLITIWMVFSSM